MFTKRRLRREGAFRKTKKALTAPFRKQRKTKKLEKQRKQKQTTTIQKTKKNDKPTEKYKRKRCH